MIDCPECGGVLRLLGSSRQYIYLKCAVCGECIIQKRKEGKMNG